MRIKLQIVQLAILLTILAPVKAFAWDDFGHMSVAYICYQNLTPETRKRVDALLKLNPYYGKWRKQIAPGSIDVNAEVFMLAATWPDAIQKDSAYHADGTDHGYRPQGAQAKNNLGYSDMLLHKYWHFKDVPFSRDGTKLPPIPEPNAETQIQAFRKTLGSDAPDALKSYDLTWLLHMVGDIHQPLHCAARVSKFAPLGDAGGNKVLLSGADGPVNLHAFWDCVLGTSDDPKAVIQYASGLLSLPPDNLNADGKKQSDSDSNTSENSWVAEGMALSQESVYTDEIGNGPGPFVVSDGYKQKAKALASRRVYLAGKRLAAILNSELR